MFGPYWELLPGRYELLIQFERDAEGDGENITDDGIVEIDVLARLHLCLARTSISHEHLHTGIHRLDFMVPKDLGRGSDALGLEFRVRVTGRILFTIGAVHTRRLGDFDWLPLMSVGEAGERCEAPQLYLSRTINKPSGQLASVESGSWLLNRSNVSGGGMRIRSIGEGFVIFGPYWELLPGRYELAIDFEGNAKCDDDSNPDDGTVVIDVLARGHLCLAQVSISGKNLRSGIQRLQFVVSNELVGESNRMNLEFRVRVVGRAMFTIRSVQTRELSDVQALEQLNTT
jgi:hypothetical protein